MSACVSCGATIIWARTPADKRMPVDAKPDPKGRLALVGGIARERLPLDDQMGRPAYTSHFATCPHAAAHRRSEAVTPKESAVVRHERVAALVAHIHWMASTVHQAHHQDSPGTLETCTHSLCKRTVLVLRGEHPEAGR
ncbi:MAG TPA: hypothetical protein VK607_10560 [Kofleriaceae bacterium]|nr:hypothetical protein [Kofleriaceae bacterium]